MHYCAQLGGRLTTPGCGKAEPLLHTDTPPYCLWSLATIAWQVHGACVARSEMTGREPEYAVDTHTLTLAHDTSQLTGRLPARVRALEYLNEFIRTAGAGADLRWEQGGGRPARGSLG
eukprot:1786076-Prymnesium_polylepis.1